MAALMLTIGILSACGTIAPSAPTSASTASWTDQDIGKVGTQGYASGGGGQPVIIHGSGNDIYGTSDSFNFDYVQASGDLTITTRVASVQKVASWTKAGVMIRASSAPDAPNVFMLLSPTNGSVMQARTSTGATTIEPGYDRAPTPPYWLRLVRKGNTFTGFQSQDGTSWTQLGTVDVTMPDPVLVGLAVTSTSDPTLAQAEFDGTDLVASINTSDPGTTPTPSPSPAPAPTGPTTTVTFQTDTSTFPNPERGWYMEPGTASATAYADAANAGYRLVMRYVRLDNYTSQALPSSFLNGLQSEFAAARGSGVKLVLRFAYNRSAGGDAPLSIVLQHISQLAPLLSQYSDVIAVLQAGFIGQWGEWHDSTNNLTSASAVQQISSALLKALPASRMIDIRTPYYARQIAPNPPSAADAFNGSTVARIGLHNDCFLSTSNDGGTFSSSSDISYGHDITRFAPMGGETCDMAGLTTRNDCPTSLSEMAAYHWDYLNSQYYTAIIDKWKTQGCYDEVSQRLGYRYTLEKLTSPTTISPGQSLAMALTMTNSGFGKLYNPRPLEIVLEPVGGGSPVTVTVADDARKVLPVAGETVTIDATAALPAGTPSGSYDVYLNLPDASPNLRGDPRYSIRLADVGSWMSSTGLNYLGLVITVP